MQILLRVILQVAGHELGSLSFNGKNEKNVYSGNHLALFECQLNAPPLLSLNDHTYREYVLMHRLNFSNWRLADMDNYMNGNPYFSDFLDESAW